MTPIWVGGLLLSKETGIHRIDASIGRFHRYYIKLASPSTPLGALSACSCYCDYVLSHLGQMPSGGPKSIYLVGDCPRMCTRIVWILLLRACGHGCWMALVEDRFLITIEVEGVCSPTVRCNGL